ncbi:urease accessory protein UreF [Thermocoleostomius sinensis]|uniref:Urease accessory protein UreF n=1 Tax=Thermocoleostomius sinensis A174 TaxID=2016057 RepID=A0A9E8ZJN2_9CYAN|nr:urease accessory protein UreF [Thermocoleostomius sinensis]WAL59726.1 urease accessory protein UreF [Thermocoleostomius sinensis A174]
MNSIDAAAFLRLLQLVSPALPVGAYSYSEGLETLVQSNRLPDAVTLEHWLTQELHYGAIRLETAVLTRIYECASTGDLTRLSYWNQWLSAFRETEELRQQSWQMGRSLLRLLQGLGSRESGVGNEEQRNGLGEWVETCGETCHFVTAFGLATVYWQIDLPAATLGYLHSWASNLVNAGVRLIPLGQTQGQQVLLNLYPSLAQTATSALNLKDDEWWSCNWGWTISSMNHETLYSRLFRS